MSAQIYQLAFGGPTPGVRYFPVTKMNDAVTRFANKVTELDKDDSVGAAWVSLTVNRGGIETNLLAWTKTSNECPTIEGETTTETIS